MTAGWRSGLGAAALAAAALAALSYLNALGNGFALDDQHIVLENVAIHSPATLPDALVSPYWPGQLGRVLGLWRPLTTLVLGVTWWLADGAPLAFHVLNVVVHAAVTAVVVLLLGRLVSTAAALLAGAVFAVHPVHVEAVANVVGLAELLSALLFLLACLVWVDGSRSWEEGGGRAHESVARRPPFAVPGAGRLTLVALLYAGAFLAKEGAVVLPAALLLLDAARGGVPLRALRRWLVPRAASFVVLGATAVAVLAARYAVLRTVADPLPPPGAALLREVPRIWTVAGVWPEYFRLLLLPLSLSSDYAPDLIPVVTVWTPRGLLGVALVLTTLAGAWLAARQGGAPAARRAIPLGVLWFVVTVLPVSNVLFLAGVLLAERNLYLPSVGFAALAGLALSRLLDARPRPSGMLLALVLAALAGRTLARNPAWYSTETITSRLIREHPEGGRAQWALGALRESEGSIPEANLAYRRAITLLNGDYAVLVDVGRRMMNQGHERAALALLERAHREAPGDATATALLAVLRARGPDPGEAVRWARLATVLDPGNVVSWHLLANALESQGRVGEAVVARQEVIRRGEAGRWQQWLALARLHRLAGDGEAADTALARAGGLEGSPPPRVLDSLAGPSPAAGPGP